MIQASGVDVARDTHGGDEMFMLGQCLWRNRRTVAVVSVVVTSGEEDIRYVKTFLVKPIIVQIL